MILNFSKKEPRESLVGISEMGVVIPEFFIGAEKMAEEQQLSLEYVNGGLGLMQARIPYNVSLQELIIKAVQKIKYQDAERFIIATESDYDLSKAVMAIKSINKGLKLTILPFQLKFACLAGVQALLLASEYAISHNKPAIVIVADRSIYGDRKAEVTQGTGVIALRIEKNPKLLALDFRNYGQYVEDIDDFKIPVNTAPFPEVDGPLTKPAYIKCVIKAYEDYKKKNLQFKTPLEKINYIVMHTPFPKMVVWTSAALWRYEKYREKEFIKLLEESVANPSLFKKFKKLLDEIRSLSEFQKFLQQKVEPGLKYNSYIGNCYNASIFISLLPVLEQIKKNQQVFIMGYGSGSGSLTIMARAIKQGFQSDLKEQIKNGKELTVAQYREWRNNVIREIRSP
ncbi:MAG: hydroxymethylglutaryl-CoA synthase [Candidatus Nealsonbacteria bacterium]